MAEGRERAIASQNRALQAGRTAGLSFLEAVGLCALEMRMRPLVWQLRAGAEQVLATFGSADKAEAKRSQARFMIDETAGLFEDDTLRAMYVEGAASKLVLCSRRVGIREGARGRA